jgi:hypothetical protein
LHHKDIESARLNCRGDISHDDKAARSSHNASQTAKTLNPQGQAAKTPIEPQRRRLRMIELQTRCPRMIKPQRQHLKRIEPQRRRPRIIEPQKARLKRIEPQRQRLKRIKPQKTPLKRIEPQRQCPHKRAISALATAYASP